MRNILKGKEILLNRLNLIQTSIGAFVAIALAYPQFEYFINDHDDTRVLARAIASLVLLVYSLRQFWLIYKGNIKKNQVNLYLIFYLLLLVLGEIAGVGYIKNWAPATNEEALISNLISFSLLFLVCIAAARVTFKKYPDKKGGITSLPVQEDKIIEIAIDEYGRLCITPEIEKFHYIYREGMDVHWDEKKSRLHGSKLRSYEGSWGYLDWYKQIIKAASEQGVKLNITKKTKWINISNNIKSDIINT